MRNLLVAVLGLVFVTNTPASRAADQKAGRDPDLPPFVPLSALLADPETLQHFVAMSQRRAAEEEAARDPTSDFEVLSSELLAHKKTGKSKLPKALIALLEANPTMTAERYWALPEVQDVLRTMVKPRDPGKGPAPRSAKQRPRARPGQSNETLLTDSPSAQSSSSPSSSSSSSSSSFGARRLSMDEVLAGAVVLPTAETSVALSAEALAQYQRALEATDG